MAMLNNQMVVLEVHTKPNPSKPPCWLRWGIVPLGTGNDFSRVAGWGWVTKKHSDSQIGVGRMI